MVRARSVLPEPGGPMSSRPWPPARAISSPRRASVWPRTSHRSGPGAARPRARHRSPRHLRIARPPRPVRCGAAPVAVRRARLVRMTATASLKVSTPITSIPVDQPRLVGRGGRDHDPAQPAPGQHGHHRQDARHGPDLAAERQLADQCQPIRSRHDLLRAEEDPDRHREIERRAGLALFGRSEIDRDPTRRMDEPRVAQRPTDALARLLQGGIGQPDDREPGQARRDIHLDPDESALEAVERCGRDDGQHVPNPRLGRSPPGHPPLTPRLSGRDDRSAARDGRRGCRDRLVDRPRELEQRGPQHRVGLGEHERRPRVERADRAAVLVDDLVLDGALQARPRRS